jgi:glutaredoxin-related protein
MNVTVRTVHDVSRSDCFNLLDGDVQCSLEDVMAFFTGANRAPPLGFENQATLTFNHQKGKQSTILATVSTCDLQLRLPTIHGSN